MTDETKTDDAISDETIVALRSLAIDEGDMRVANLCSAMPRLGCSRLLRCIDRRGVRELLESGIGILAGSTSRSTCTAP